MLPNGMTVRVDETTAHEPDALIYCGPELASSAIDLPNTKAVVEVISPSTCHIDAQIKFAGYFRLPSVAHYLVINPDKPLILHHARNADGTVLTRIVNEGTLALDPPGIEIAVADTYSAT
jgi:Uma2 family endonuclease